MEDGKRRGDGIQPDTTVEVPATTLIVAKDNHVTRSEVPKEHEQKVAGELERLGKTVELLKLFVRDTIVPSLLALGQEYESRVGIIQAALGTIEKLMNTWQFPWHTEEIQLWDADTQDFFGMSFTKGAIEKSGDEIMRGYTNMLHIWALQQGSVVKEFAVRIKKDLELIEKDFKAVENQLNKYPSTVDERSKYDIESRKFGGVRVMAIEIQQMCEGISDFMSNIKQTARDKSIDLARLPEKIHPRVDRLTQVQDTLK